MEITLAFDIYGTLVDPSAMAAQVADEVGSDAAAFAGLWRSKQLEYAFRRGLMRNYADFSVCTREALAFACRRFGISLTAERREDLLHRYQELPAFEEAPRALEVLARHYRLFAFSNGTAQQVDAVLSNAGLRAFFAGIVSVDDVRSFKPDPAVYAYARRATECWSSPLWLVSSNPWDVIGARSAGLDAVWIRRSEEAIYDPWGIEPSATAPSLAELIEVLPRNSAE